MVLLHNQHDPVSKEFLSERNIYCNSVSYYVWLWLQPFSLMEGHTLTFILAFSYCGLGLSKDGANYAWVLFWYNFEKIMYFYQKVAIFFHNICTSINHNCNQKKKLKILWQNYNFKYKKLFHYVLPFSREYRQYHNMTHFTYGLKTYTEGITIC